MDGFTPIKTISLSHKGTLKEQFLGNLEVERLFVNEI
jgi:hypothetical protein